MVTCLGEERSFEAYRNLFQAATPASIQQIMSKRIRVHQPVQAKTIEDVPKTISTWKGLRREFEELSGEHINPNEERHLILQMCPPNLQEKLMDKWDLLSTSQFIEY